MADLSALTGIPGSIRYPQPINPLQPVQLFDLMSQAKERQQIGQWRQAEMSKLKREQDIDNKIQESISQAGGSLFNDDGTEKPVADYLRSLDATKAEKIISGGRDAWENNQIHKVINSAADPNASPTDPDYINPITKPDIAKQLYKINPTKADKIYAGFYQSLDAEEKANTSRFNRMKTIYNEIAPIVTPSVDPETLEFKPSIVDQPSLNAARQSITNKLQALGAPPQLAQKILGELGDTYDPVETPRKIQSMDNEFQDSATLAKQHADTLARHKDRTVEIGKWPEQAGQLFGGATTDPLWSAARGQALQLGIPKEFLDTLRQPGESAADAAKRAEQMGMTPAQRTTAANKTRTEEQLTADALKGDATAQAILDEMQKRKISVAAATAAVKEGSAPELTPEAKDAAALKWAMTGELPSMGMGSAAQKSRVEIMNRGAELLKGQDLASQSAAYKALSTTLGQLTKNAGSISAFESTAMKNLDLFLQTAKKVVGTGSPLINKPLRDIDQNALGSDDVAAYKAARQVALTEIAKVLNNPNSSVALSENARKEALSLSGEGATISQLYKVAQTLKQDMANRKGGFQDQINATQQAIANLNPSAKGGGGAGAGRIKVKRKSDNKVGTILESDFDPAKYDKIQ